MIRIVSLALVAVSLSSPVLAQQPYRAEQGLFLVDPYGEDARRNPDVARPSGRDPVAAFQKFPRTWTRMQRTDICQPVFRQGSATATGWMCRMSDGHMEFIE